MMINMSWASSEDVDVHTKSMLVSSCLTSDAIIEKLWENKPFEPTLPQGGPGPPSPLPAKVGPKSALSRSFSRFILREYLDPQGMILCS